MEGGHDVAMRKIIARYTRQLSSCGKIGRRAYVMTIPSKMPPARLLFRMADGLLIKNYGNINPSTQEVPGKTDQLVLIAPFIDQCYPKNGLYSI